MRGLACLAVVGLAVSCGGARPGSTGGSGTADGGSPGSGAPSGHVQLSVRVSGSGHVTSTPPGVSCPGTCSAVFDAGSSLQLAATPDDGFDFAGWSGACSGRGACSLTMTADESVAASFTAGGAPSISVAISPTEASLAPGAMQRFVATVSGSSDSGVVWSVLEGAAGGLVDSSGLYTAPQASGTFHVVAASHADPSRTATATVTVTGATVSRVTSCGAITAPGNLVVTADLSSSGTCLDVHDTHDVTLDCAGHSVGGQPALNMTDVDRFSVTNCTFVSTGAVGVVTLLRTSNGTFAGDTFGTTFVNVVRGLDLRIDHNTFNGSYQQGYSKRVVFSTNSMVSQTRGSASSAALVVSDFGSDNRMVDNVIDGRWDGVRIPLHQTETDDGIVIADETGDTISGNTIANVFDCGIETSGVIANAAIANNRISNTGICGIGGWYWNSLSASTISGNTVEGAPTLFLFFRIFGLRPAGFDSLHELPSDSVVLFNDNTFDGNRLVNPYVQAGVDASIFWLYSNLNYSGSISNTPGERVARPSDFVVKNNTFRNNDFGKALSAPLFGTPVVPGVVIDGGGNICKNDGGAGYPLVCH